MSDRVLGRVIEIFLPEDMEKIGFKIEIDKKIITIIEKQNEENANIFKDDFVFINKSLENDKEVYKIEILGEVEDE